MYQEAMTSLKQILDAMHRPGRVRESARKLCNPYSLKKSLPRHAGSAAGSCCAGPLGELLQLHLPKPGVRKQWLVWVTL